MAIIFFAFAVSASAYLFFAFSDLSWHFEDTRIDAFGCTLLPDSEGTELGSNNQEAYPLTAKSVVGVLVLCHTYTCVLQLFLVV